MTTRRVLIPSAALATVFLLSGCAASEAGQFCSDVEAAGGDAGTLSLLQSWQPKESLQPQLETRLAVYDAATPPEEIADDWAAVRDFTADVAAAAEQLPAGGAIGDPEIISATVDIGDANGRVLDYFAEHCL